MLTEACRGDSARIPRIPAARVIGMGPRHDRLRRAALVSAAVVTLLAGLAACAPEPGTGPSAGPSPTVEGPGASASATPEPSASPTPQAAIPDDCVGMLSEIVAAQLSGVPLNDPALGEPTGKQPDGSLVCVWRDPAADTTHLVTTISKMDRGPALEMLNQLADDLGFNCYTPDLGTRCEKTWPNVDYPVTDGRTLFWRDGILIDTRYSNLAPEGYTSAIVASLWG